MIFLSSNHYSHDLQVIDVMNWLGTVQRDKYEALVSQYPEWNNYVMDGSWFDIDKMGVNQEWSMWLTASIEQDTNVFWTDGEPAIMEQCDEDAIDAMTGELLDTEGNSIPTEDAAECHRMAGLTGLTASQVAILWGEYSDRVMCAGWIAGLGNMTVEQFNECLSELTATVLHDKADRDRKQRKGE